MEVCINFSKSGKVMFLALRNDNFQYYSYIGYHTLNLRFVNYLPQVKINNMSLKSMY